MLRSSICSLLLLFWLCKVASAVPAAPDPLEILQPDGTVIKVQLKGDEFQNWHEAEDSGHTIIKNETTAYWEYAEKGKDDSLQKSGIRVLPNGLNAPKSTPKGLKPKRNKENELQFRQMLAETYLERLSSTGVTGSSSAAAAPGDWIAAPVSGARKLLVILVSFTDKVIITTPAGWSTSVFNELSKSVAKFYQDNSYATLSITPATHTQPGSPVGVVSVTIPSTHPNTGGNFTFGSDQSWGNSALQQAAPFIDFNSFDINGNGKLETTELVIYFIAAGYESSAGSGLTPAVWAHAWWTSGTGLTAGTKNVQRWALNGELYNSSTAMQIGVIAHELGHQLCGLPDLYDISGNNTGMGEFSLMAGGSWGGDTGEVSGATPTTLDAWSREYLGWAAPATPVSASQLTFNTPLSSPAAATKFILPASSNTEYFLAENRFPVNWDLGLKKRLGSSWQGGLLITHIDNSSGTSGGNDLNSYSANIPTPGHQGVVPVQASTALCTMLTVGASCRGHATSLFYSGNNGEWTVASTPDSRYYNATGTGFSLTGISLPGASMTANLTIATPPEPPVIVTAAASDSQATVSFAAPVSDGGTPIIDYSLKSTPGAFTATAPTTPITISGLTNGTAYAFTVTARNAVGSGSPSAASSSVTPKGVPTAPSIQSVTPANGAATVSFNPPASDGGSPVIDYSAVSSPGGYSSVGTASPLTVTGLANGTAYTFSVTARNILGTGIQSASSAVVTANAAVKIGASSYDSILEAYTAAIAGGILQLRAADFSGDINFNRNIAVALKGGYDPAYSTIIGMATIIGAVTVTDGAISLENLTIR